MFLADGSFDYSVGHLGFLLFVFATKQPVYIDGMPQEMYVGPRIAALDGFDQISVGVVDEFDFADGCDFAVCAIRKSESCEVFESTFCPVLHAVWTDFLDSPVIASVECDVSDGGDVSINGICQAGFSDFVDSSVGVVTNGSSPDVGQLSS
jgi:hypothetical protein